MAKATLPTNYQDDILNVSTEGKRKYRMNYNDDGTVSFVDVTPYDQEGSDFGAGDINATNQAVNESFDKNKLIRDMDAINALTEEGYAPDALALKDVNDSLVSDIYVGDDGKLHKVQGGADSVLPFSSGGLHMKLVVNASYKGSYVLDVSNIDTIKYKVTNLSGTGNFLVYSISDEDGERYLTATTSLGEISDKVQIATSGDTSEYKEVDVSEINYIYLDCSTGAKIVELLGE